MFGKPNKLAPILIVTVLSLVFSAVAPAWTAVGAADPTPTPAAKSNVKLALVLIGELTDLSWNAQMFKAVKQVEQDMGVRVAYSEQVADADAERVLREYADEGYNLIIAHSFSFGDALFRVAPDYPSVNFAWAGGINKTAQNVADYDQPFYQAAYLIGILAGSVSKTGTLNSLGGFDIPVCHSMAESFLAGARAMNPNAKLLSSYVGDWGDVAKAKEAALAQIEAGADFAVSCGEGPTLGSIEAAKEKGTLATGYVGDMTEVATQTVAISLVWDLYTLVGQMVKDTEQSTFQPGKYYSFGVAQDGLKVVINPAFDGKFPQKALDEMAKVEKDIKAGTFTVPYVPQAEAAPTEAPPAATEASK
jgi:simple sugar transport system substrate-binding protein/basic membrane protein A